MIYKSPQLGKPVMQRLIQNNPIDEEEKSVIHKLNQVIAMFLNTGRNQIWIILINSYYLQKTKIAKVVINQMQTDNINMKQKIDIMKAKAIAEHQFLSQSVLDIHYPDSPTSEDDPYYKK
jgi:phenylpyruvate tautomerase PptA (4-oxalocrotonate tautomerase family)